MLNKLQEIKSLLDNSRSEDVIKEVNDYLTDATLPVKDRATAYYMRGNAYRQLGDWRRVMNDYCEAMDLDPDGPAAEAYRSVVEILNFYNHDMYNP